MYWLIAETTAATDVGAGVFSPSPELYMLQGGAAVGNGVAVFLFILFGGPIVLRWLKRQEDHYDKVLNRQLLMNTNARHFMFMLGGGLLLIGVLVGFIAASPFWGLIAMVAAFFLPNLLINHIIEKRREKLDHQLVDALTTLSSGVRAGLNLIQSIDLMVRNSHGPVKQEFAEMLREYEFGVDLHQAMRNTADRIGSTHYRLVFTALQAHRERGGNMAESLDRISDSVREIQRLEGKLKTLTAQGRAQARMMAFMPVVIVFILYLLFPDETTLTFTEPLGRIMLLIAAGIVGVAFVWIRQIMSIDI